MKNSAISNFNENSADVVSPNGVKFPIIQKGRLHYLYRISSKKIRKENTSV